MRIRRKKTGWRIRVTLFLGILLFALAGLGTRAGAEQKKDEEEERFYRYVYVSGDWEYTVYPDGTAQIIGSVPFVGEVRFPGEIEGYVVSRLGAMPATTFYPIEGTHAVYIPESVSWIDPLSFCWIWSPTEFHVDAGNKTYSVMDGMLVDRTNHTLTAVPVTCRGTCQVPEEIMAIGPYAFRERGITSVVLHDGVQSIGEKAFVGCDSLRQVNLPESITEIDASAFEGCEKLTAVVSPHSYALDYCRQNQIPYRYEKSRLSAGLAAVARSQKKESGYLLDNAAILRGMGFKQSLLTDFDRYLQRDREKNKNGYYEYDILPIEEEDAAYFDYRADFDGDGRDEILAGVKAGKGRKEHVRLIMLEYENGRWKENAGYGGEEADGRPLLLLTEIGELYEDVFLLEKDGRYSIFVERHLASTVAWDGADYCLHELRYDGVEFYDFYNPAGEREREVSYCGSDITAAFFQLDPISAYDEWGVRFIQKTIRNLEGMGLETQPLHHPMFLHTEGAIPLFEYYLLYRWEVDKYVTWHKGDSGDLLHYGKSYIRGSHRGWNADGEMEENLLSDIRPEEYTARESSERPLSGLEISDLVHYGLAQTAINEIYARHGYIFRTPEIQAYFEEKPWYKGTVLASDFDESVLSEIEKDNIERLRKADEAFSRAEESKVTFARKNHIIPDLIPEEETGE